MTKNTFVWVLVAILLATTFVLCGVYFFIFPNLDFLVQEIAANLAFLPIEIILVVILIDRIMEGGLTESLRRRRMEKLADKFNNHYIVCGIGRVGLYVLSELHAIKVPHVLIDINKDNIEKILESFKDEVFIVGDADNNNVLLKAGIKRARGLFALTGDDNQNLVISLTAKQLNPDLRIVSRCNEIENSEKISRAGADAIVNPNFIGGLRMASEMIRPTAVSFLDIMLRDREKNLRVEEFSIPDTFIGKTISALNLKRYPNTVLLAVRTQNDWIYAPTEDYVLTPQNTLIVMTVPELRDEIEKFLHTKE